MQKKRNVCRELPDLLRFQDGRRVETPAQWRERRGELLEMIMDVEYGPLPPGGGIWSELLNSHTAKLYHGSPQYCQYRLGTEKTGDDFGFRLDLMIPQGDERLPVALTGDGCWRYLTDDVTNEVMRRGWILAVFSRVEIVPDIGTQERNTGLNRVLPGGDFGALAAWAWGYHRCVDFLLTHERVNTEQIAVVGHSRGGKAALLAGAADERIALTNPNNSGCGGAGCFRVQGEGSETIADITRSFPHWFSRKFADFAGREDELPFDQHALKALVAPRALLTTEALGDLWANPSGTWQTHRAAREVYELLDAGDRIGIAFREGGHSHGINDWITFLDFADWQLRGRPARRGYDASPF